MFVIPKTQRPVFDPRDSLALDCIVDYPIFKWKGRDTYDVCQKIPTARYGTYNGTSITGSAHWGMSKWGQYVRFFGEGGFQNRDTRLNVGSWNVPAINQLTLGCIVKINTLSDLTLKTFAGFFSKASAKTATTTDWSLELNRFADMSGVHWRFRFLVKTTGITAVASTYTTTDVVAGQWYHIVGVYNGSNVTIYVDGLPASPTSLTGNVKQSSNDVSIGAKHDSVTTWLSCPCDIAQAFAVSRAWSTKEIWDWKRDPFRRNRQLKPRIMPIVSRQGAPADVEVEALDVVLGSPSELAEVEVSAFDPLLGSSGPVAEIEVEALDAVLGSPAAVGDVEVEGLDAVLGSPVERADVEVEALDAVLGSSSGVAEVEVEASDAILGSSAPTAEIEVEALNPVLASPTSLAEIEIEAFDALLVNVAEAATVNVEALDAILGNPAPLAEIEIQAFDGAIAVLSQISTVEVEAFDTQIVSVAVIADIEVEGFDAVLGSPAAIAEVEVEGLDATDIEALLAEIEIEAFDPFMYVPELKAWCLVAKSRVWKLAPKQRIWYLMNKAREFLISTKERVWKILPKSREFKISPKDRTWRFPK